MLSQEKAQEWYERRYLRFIFRYTRILYRMDFGWEVSEHQRLMNWGVRIVKRACI